MNDPGFPPGVRVFGIRHHGPGSARSLRSALEHWQPDRILIEGPPEADALVPFVADPGLVPPVALLAYRVDNPAAAAFWPFAEFSPEWQALRWAHRYAIPATFMDLPAAAVLAGHAEGQSPAESLSERTGVRIDPIAALAAAAGQDDPERWWEDVIESSGSTDDPFDAVADAMAAVRGAEPETDLRTLQREAQMRKTLRAAQKSGAQRIAVVCGAWHVPAFQGKLPTISADNTVLKGLPTTKVTTTWVPWTHSRLAYASGYGAGVRSPGWYRHLFSVGKNPVETWMTRAAGVLRAHYIPTSTAHVIEAVRLADALAALRGRPGPGLAEVTDAIRAVLCEGNPTTLEFVQREAVVGQALGTVPEAAPMVPLEADLRATARTLRLKFEATPKVLTLDLRTDNDLRRSHLLHRLQILSVNWGEPTEVSGIGTFKEGWLVEWFPELSVSVVEASLWGTTVAAGAEASLLSGADSLPRCTAAIADAITADLPETMTPLLVRLDRFAAGTADVTLLLDALPSLVRAARYGTVRGSDTTAVAEIAQALLTRINAGLPAALGGLGPEAAGELRKHIERAHEAVPLLPEGPARDGWYLALGLAMQRRDLPPLLAGRVVRLLLDAGHQTREEAGRRLHATLSVGTPASEKADWIDGFVAGDALLLIHDLHLLRLIDHWVAALGAEEFLDVVPMLRRSFGTFAPAERGNLLRLARDLSGRAEPVAEPELDLGRAGGVLATARQLLGSSA